MNRAASFTLLSVTLPSKVTETLYFPLLAPNRLKIDFLERRHLIITKNHSFKESKGSKGSLYPLLVNGKGLENFPLLKINFIILIVDLRVFRKTIIYYPLPYTLP